MYCLLDHEKQIFNDTLIKLQVLAQRFAFEMSTEKCRTICPGFDEFGKVLENSASALMFAASFKNLEIFQTKETHRGRGSGYWYTQIIRYSCAQECYFGVFPKCELTRGNEHQITIKNNRVLT